MVNTSVQSSSQGVKSAGQKKTRLAKGKVKRRNGSHKTGLRNESMTAHLYRQGRDAVTGAYDAAAKAGNYMPHLPQFRRQSVYAMIEERPLVMGAVGLGIGMILASLLPAVSHRR